VTTSTPADRRLGDVVAAEGATTPPPPRRAERRAGRSARRLLGFVVPAALLVLWHLAGERGWVSPILLPTPAEVAASGVEFFRGDRVQTIAGVVPFDGAGWYHLSASLGRCAVSWAAAVGVGLSLGLALGLSRLVSDLLDPLVNGLRAIPLYAWLPLTLVWFGLGEGAARALIFLGALWPVLVATSVSVARVPRAYLETARMLGTPRRRMWRRVYLPAALPEIVTGLRLSLTLAWTCVIVGELTGTARGVGAMMNAAREVSATEQILVGMVLFALVGLLADRVLRLAAARTLRWSET
jgi:ABC-type nitrate/sulfonate/bicarbonate transport system permease component